jgi:hypothetical protein
MILLLWQSMSNHGNDEVILLKNKRIERIVRMKRILKESIC